MMNFVSYSTTTGKIEWSASVSSEENLHAPSAGFAILEVEGDCFPWDTYVRLSDLTPQPRAALPSFDKTTCTANGTDPCSIQSGLPNPTSVTVSSPANIETISVTDGSLALSFSAAGSYDVQLDGGPQFLMSRTMITAS
jgi:hypothetical protein